MSNQDKIEITEAILKGKEIDKKWNLYKIGTVILCMFSSTFYLGSQVGDWKQWRVTTTQEVKEVKDWKEIVQSSLNAQRADYNRNIKIKGQ